MKQHQSADNSQGQLYIVPTPIGNLADITQRALEVLQAVDLIAAEDTRHTGLLLQHFGINARLFALHDHNEQQKAEIKYKNAKQMKEAAKAHFRTDIDKNESNTSSDSASHFTYTIVDACFYFVLSVIFVLLVYFYPIV